MEMTLINQLSAGVCGVWWRLGAQRAGPTVNHACSQWAAPSSSTRLSCSLHTAVGSLLPGTSKSIFFSKSRWKSGENPPHNDSRWHLAESKTRDYAVGSSYILFGADLISFRFCPDTLLWHHLRWSLNNSILQEEFTSTEQMNANHQEFYFQGQLALHPTAHQSVILLDGFGEHPAMDALPSGPCLFSGQ